MEKREKFASRLGFLLISAGCAIGIGNVWRFPYITGQYGGAAFVLIYLFFLVVLGLPIMAMEFAVGRASRKSRAVSFRVLEPAGTKWHWYAWLGMAGNYLLMMFYTTVAGWMLAYVVKMLRGAFTGASAEAVGGIFNDMLAQPGPQIFWMIVAVVLGFGVCSLGLQNGVEKITKAMMVCLLLLMVALAVRSVTLPGADEGLKFYLVPDFGRLVEQGVGNVVYAAMGQAFFTLSLGIGAMAIFGSYIGKERTLLSESVNITLLDTFVALMAGLIIFPACFSFGVNPGQGPGLVFVTLPNIFGGMAGEEILVKTGVLAEGAGRLVPTLGGLLAAGVYPQQFFPRLNIVLTVRGTGETCSINGPVPCMVETAVNLLAERLRTADGFVYPLRACREAVVNALQHRDYSPEGRGSQVRIDLFDDRLEFLNPGGLFRAAVFNRQIHGLAALRNANLTRILECTPCPDADGRPGAVLEPGTQGLLLIDEALEVAGRPRAVVHDWVSAVSLVFFREERIVHWTDFEYDLTTALSERDSIALTEIVRCSGLSRSTVLAKLRRMIDAGLIERTEPLHSPRQRYRLSS